VAENQIGRRKISCPVTGNCFGDCSGRHMVLVWIAPGSEILPLVNQMHTMSQTNLPPFFRVVPLLYLPGINNSLFIIYLIVVRYFRLSQAQNSYGFEDAKTWENDFSNGALTFRGL
jgi:hypothetical protein